MSTHLIPIKTALITFPILAIFITIPFAIVQYRKYGYINKIRTGILYSFLLYLITAYYLVIMPLPKSRDVKSNQRTDIEYYNLKPFNFIDDIKRETDFDIKDTSTYRDLLSERSFLQIFFNILLVVPFGVYLRYYFNKSLLDVILSSFLLSLFFEITQVTGLYGIYNAPYRIFDVDDLMFNTLGGGLGYLIAPMFTFFLPSSKNLDEGVDLENLRVGFPRRSLAFLIDMLVLSLIPNFSNNLAIKYGTFALYFILLVYLTNGRTLGKFLTRTKVAGQGERLRFKEVLERYGILYFGIFGLNDILNRIMVLNQGKDYAYILVYAGVFKLIIIFLLGADFLIAFFGRDRLFYEKMSKTRIKVAKK